jgi:pimeloyl-ACP methyl ester carboxylesterase
MQHTLLLFCLSLSFSGCGTPGQAQTSAYMDSLHYSYETKTISLSDTVSITYVDEGEGPETLVFIHGLGSYLPAWRKNIAELSKRYRCIALDLPGYGKSSRGEYPFDMTFFADQVSQFLQQLSLKKPTIVGHSMGGQIALTLALQQPEGVGRLVLVAPAGFEKFTDQERAWFRQVYTPAVVRATPPPQIERNFALNFHKSEFPEDAHFMYQDRLRMRADTALYEAYCEMIPQCVQGMLQEPVFDRLPDVKQPTLVLYGRGDLLIPNTLLHPDLTTEEVARAGHQKMPGSQLKLLDACGHFVQWECAEAVNTAIQSFVTNQ